MSYAYTAVVLMEIRVSDDETSRILGDVTLGLAVAMDRGSHVSLQLRTGATALTDSL